MRQTTLDHMGIQTWTLRRPAPNSKPDAKLAAEQGLSANRLLEAISFAIGQQVASLGLEDAAELLTHPERKRKLWQKLRQR